LNTILKSALLSHLEHLSLVIGERNLDNSGSLEAAAQYIFEQFASTGLKTLRHEFTFEDHTFANIEAILPGPNLDTHLETIVIGAHYDSVPGSPGANDNGTGVAAILALADILKSSQPQRNIRFVAFANEESPYFNGEGMGSLNFARACKRANENVVAMYSLETMGYFSNEEGSQSYPPGVTGYPSCGNFIAFVANLASAPLLEETKKLFQEHSKFPFQTIAAPESTPGVSLSDHMSFWQMDYPAIMVTDTAPFRYPHYHTAQDTPDKIDLDMFTELVDNLGKTFAALAGIGAERL
jgi:Zn-dependent M28 family amino/carboxypeptidase